MLQSCCQAWCSEQLTEPSVISYTFSWHELRWCGFLLGLALLDSNEPTEEFVEAGM
jgi:hypothetical protein